MSSDLPSNHDTPQNSDTTCTTYAAATSKSKTYNFHPENLFNESLNRYDQKDCSNRDLKKILMLTLSAIISLSITPMDNSVKILYRNCQSIRNKITGLNHLVFEHKVQMILLHETHLNQYIHLKLPDFHTYIWY